MFRGDVFSGHGVYTVLKLVHFLRHSVVRMRRRYSYLVRIRMISITSPEERRDRGDMIKSSQTIDRKRENRLQAVLQLHKRTIQPHGTREETGKGHINIGYKENLLQSKTRQWMEWSSGRRD